MKASGSYDDVLKSVNGSIGYGPHNVTLEGYSLRDLVPNLPTAS